MILILIHLKLVPSLAISRVTVVNPNHPRLLTLTFWFNVSETSKLGTSLGHVPAAFPSSSSSSWNLEHRLKPSSKKTEIPVYSFSKHQRTEQTTTIYSPHVLILEGIFALYDPRILELLDMKVGTCHEVKSRKRRLTDRASSLDLLRCRRRHVFV